MEARHEGGQVVVLEVLRLPMMYPSNEDRYAMWIKMLQGLKCSEDHDATMIKMQRGSRCNKDQDATRIKMQITESALFTMASFRQKSTAINHETY